MNEETLQAFQSEITGEVVTKNSPEYEALRNSFIYKGSPLLIVVVKTTKDIASAIQFARDNKLALSVRSGGHGFSGLSTNDDGLIIDLSHFNGIEIDEDLYNVRVGAGALWGDVAKKLDEYGLAVSSGDTNGVGVGGLTLGGGVGWQVRNLGLAIDNLESVEIVTASGEVLRASATEHPDLFWAVRGGGGNFGVVTSFVFRAHELKQILKGSIVYPVGELESVLAKWNDAMRQAPEELNSTFVVVPGFGPDPKPALMVLTCCPADDETVARNMVQPLLELGTVQHQDLKVVRYYQMLEDVPSSMGSKTFAQTGFVKTMDEPFVKAVAANYGRVGTAILQIRRLGGVMSRVPASETAFAFRDYEGLIWSVSLASGEISDDEIRKMSGESWAPIKPFTEGGYVNFLSSADDEATRTVYPPATYERLAKIKAIYDPENIFNRNANIKPQK